MYFSKKRYIFLWIVIPYFTFLSFQNCAPGHVFKSQISASSVNTDRFLSAKAVLEARCIQCHTSGGLARNFNLATETEFIQAGLITPGLPEQSSLIYRLKNYRGLPAGGQNMPTNGTLTDREYNTLFEWVTLMGRPQTITCTTGSNLLKPQIKRLTPMQFKNSLIAVFGSIFSDNQFPTLNETIPKLDFANDPQLMQVNQVNINAYYDSTLLLANTISGSVFSIVNCVNSTTDSCFTSTLQTYGPLLWRRPLTSTEINDIQSGLTAIQATNVSRRLRMNYLLAQLILSPNHLFLTELGTGSTPQQSVFYLTHYEIASLLSFSIWDSPPDTTLYNLARDQRLHSIAILKEQAQRMASDPRSAKKLSSFVVELLKLDLVKTVLKNASFNLTSQERNDLFLSANAGLDSVYGSPSANFLAAFSQQPFYVNSSSARFFNTPTTGLTTNFTPLTLPTNQRHGILSHPAFLTVQGGEVASGIVKRGVFTLEQLLCYHMPPAPANTTPNLNLPPDFDPTALTAREELRVTHSSQTSCMGCHQSIDPTGFAYENFNAIGSFRLTERNNLTIDASGSIAGIISQPISFTNSTDFFRKLERSPDFQKCMKKKYFKYLSGQSAQSGAGQCEFENFEKNSLTKPSSVGGVFESFIELESFVRRNPAGN